MSASARRRALVELLLAAALLAIAAVVAHGRGGVDLGLVALATALAGPGFARLLVARGRIEPAPAWTSALGLAAIASFVVLPGAASGPWPIALASLESLWLVRSLALSLPSERATALEEALAPGLALVPAALGLATFGGDLGRLDALSGPLVVFAALAVESRGTGSDRSAGAAARRACTGALVGASAVACGFEPGRSGLCPGTTALVAAAIAATGSVLATRPPSARSLGALALLGAQLVYRSKLDFELALALACATGLGLATPESVPRRARPLVLGAVYVLLLGAPLDHAPLAIRATAGIAAGALAVLGLAGLVFFGAALGWEPAGRPRGWRVLAATVLATLVALEGGLRLKEDERFDLALSTVPLTVVGGGHEDMRGHVFTPRKPDGVYRIALLGGSSAWGHVQKDRETSLTGRLEARAPALGGRRVEVLCLAFRGLSSDQELAFVGAHALEWDVDLFLAIDGYNDLAYLAGSDAYPGDHYAWPQHRVGLGSPFARAVVRRSALLGPLVARATGALLPPADIPARLRPGAANGFWLDGLAANEDAIAVLARDAGARFAWAFVPLIHDRATRGPGEPELPPTGPEVLRRRAEAIERVAPLVSQRGGVVLDLIERVKSRSRAAAGEAWFTDECHYTDRGMDVLAEETWAALLAAGAVAR